MRIINVIIINLNFFLKKCFFLVYRFKVRVIDMIIEACYENFRSIKEKTIFDMSAESICEFKNSVLRWNRNKTDEFRVVPLKILYGQNASGKTNVLLGIQVLKEMILGSTLKMHFHLPYEEMVNNEHKLKPVTLGLSFLHNNKVFDYEVTFTKNRIVHETLHVNRSRLFERTEHNIELAKTNKSVEYFNEKRVSTLELNERQCTFFCPDSLFLTQGFRSFIAPTLVNEMLEFFEEKLFIELDFANADAPVEVINKEEVDAFLKEANLGISCQQETPLSKGSKKIIHLADILISSMRNDKVLILGDMETGMNPTVVMLLLHRLHAKANQSTQLIFDTHNPIYMDKSFIRRDEVTFVSKSKEEGTGLRSLLSYASRENNYFRKYLNGEYDTIPVINLEAY